MTNASGKSPVGRIRPAINEDTVHFWREIDAHRFAIQRCVSCETLRHPPAAMCAHCQSMDWTLVTASGRGEVHSFTVIRHPAVPPFDYPNCVGLITLEEGVRVISQIVDIDPELVEIGMPVSMRFDEVEPGFILPLFFPAGASS